MFGLFKTSNTLLNRREKKRIVCAIQDIEQKTSGELRVYIEGECPYNNPLQRAEEVFKHLGMDKTQLRNGVLLYIASESRVYSIFGDQAIYAKANNDFWQEKIELIQVFFKNQQYAEGIEMALKNIGSSLSEYFPTTGTRKNELPDDIVFGKFN
jgi:uncharacterized membrane protein